jgi:hypothetical protein
MSFVTRVSVSHDLYLLVGAKRSTFWLERSERSERSDQLTIFWSDLVVLSTV